jgi:hypothetical protein
MSPGACRRRWEDRFLGIPHHAGRCDPRGQPPAIRGTENGWGHREKGGGGREDEDRFRVIPYPAGRCDPRGQPPVIWGHRELIGAQIKEGGAEKGGR